MDLLRSRVQNESLKELLDTCGQFTSDCLSIANALNTAPVTLVALAKKSQAVSDTLHRLSELSNVFTVDAEGMRATNNAYIHAVAMEIHETKAALKRIKGPDRDSGIGLAEPRLIIVWNEPALKDSLVRLSMHQASLQTLLRTIARFV